MLVTIGEDPHREGLLKTPQRFAKSFKEMTIGYEQNSADLVNGALFTEAHDGMIILKDIEFFSLCEHHLLPFFGKASIAYIPNGTIIGLSKIPRIVNMFARRLQVQERLTDQICDELHKILNPKGVACSIASQHMCMMMRGVQVQSSTMVTHSARGVFKESAQARQEFFEALKGG